MDRRLCFVTVVAVFLLAGCGKKEEEAPGDETAAPAAESAAQAQKTALASEELTRNPFLSAEEENEFRDSGKAIPLETLALSAILYSSADRSKAILQGRILEKGDSIGDKKVVEIRPEAVILKDDAAEYIVRLRNL